MVHGNELVDEWNVMVNQHHSHPFLTWVPISVEIGPRLTQLPGFPKFHFGIPRKLSKKEMSFMGNDNDTNIDLALSLTFHIEGHSSFLSPFSLILWGWNRSLDNELVFSCSIPFRDHFQDVDIQFLFMVNIWKKEQELSFWRWFNIDFNFFSFGNRVRTINSKKERKKESCSQPQIKLQMDEDLLWLHSLPLKELVQDSHTFYFLVFSVPIPKSNRNTILFP